MRRFCDAVWPRQGPRSGNREPPSAGFPDPQSATPKKGLTTVLTERCYRNRSSDGWPAHPVEGRRQSDSGSSLSWVFVSKSAAP